MCCLGLAQAGDATGPLQPESRVSARGCAGLELFFIDAPGAAAGGGPTWDAPSAFFVFASEEERERAAAALTGQPLLGSSLPGGRGAAAAAGSILEARRAPHHALMMWLHGARSLNQAVRDSSHSFGSSCGRAPGAMPDGSSQVEMSSIYLVG